MHNSLRESYRYCLQDLAICRHRRQTQMRTRMRIEGKRPSVVSSRLQVPWVGRLPPWQASVQQGLGREGFSNPLKNVVKGRETIVPERIT